MKKSINSPIHLKNGIPGFYSDSLIIRVPNFNLFCGCTPWLAWAASCQWWDSVLDWKSAGSWGPNIEATVIWYCCLCDFHCYGACDPVLLETVWWLESLRVESVGGFSSVGVFWSILPQEPFDSEGDGLVCDNWVKAVPTGCTPIPTLPLPLPLNSNAASTGPESPDMNTSWTWETKDTAVVEGGSAAQSETKPLGGKLHTSFLVWGRGNEVISHLHILHLNEVYLYPFLFWSFNFCL